MNGRDRMSRVRWSGAKPVLLSLLLMISVIVPLVVVPTSSEGGSTRGSVLHVGEGQTYTKIQDAIDNATEGDEVYVHEGSYKGGVVIDVDGIIVRGEGEDSTHIYGVQDRSTVLILSDNVILKDLKVTGNEKCAVDVRGNHTEIGYIDVSGSYIGGMYIIGHNQTVIGTSSHHNRIGYEIHSNDSSIQGCYAMDNEEDGFLVNGDIYGTELIDCMSLNNGEFGFEAWAADNISFEGCKANYNVFGFGLELCQKIAMRDCTANFNSKQEDEDNTVGLWLFGAYSQLISIINCTFIGNDGDGMKLMLDGDLSVSGCIIYGNGGNGIGAKSLYPETGGAFLFHGNLIMNNSLAGVLIEDGEGAAGFDGNDFIGNNKTWAQAVDNSSSIWYRGTKGNHWSDHTSPDSNGDGIVDTPYSVAGKSGSKDMYPLVSRVTNHPVPVLNGSGMDIYPPLIATPIEKRVQGASMYYVQNLTAIDLDTPQEDLAWTVQSDYPGLFMRGSVLSGYIAFEGIFWVNVTVSDGTHSDHENFTLVVGDRSNITLAPRVLNITISSYYVNESLTIGLSAYDPDTPSSALFWSLRTGADWLSLIGDKLTGTPTMNGTYWFEVTVFDGNSSDTRNFTIIVWDRPIAQNKPPELSLIDLPTAFVRKPFKATLSAYDADGDDLDWQLLTDVAFLSLNGNILSGTPNSSDVGNHSVRIVISDGKANASISFTVKVMDELEGEDIYDIDMEKNITSGKLTVSIRDLFGKDYVDIVETEWYVDGEYFGNGTSIELNLVEGDHTIKLRFKDSDGQWYEVIKTIGMGDVDEDTDSIYLLVGVSVLTLLLVVTLSMVALLIVRKHRRLSVEEAGAINPEMGMDWGDDGISGPGQSPGLRSGPLTPWKGPRDRFGPDPGTRSCSGPMDREDVGTIMDRIRSEALSDMRPSRSSLSRDGMSKKLREKYTSGDIDRELYEELRSFIDDNVGE